MSTTILHLGSPDATLAQVVAGAGLKYLNISDAEKMLSAAPAAAMLFANHDADLSKVLKDLRDNKINLPTVAIGPAQPAANAAKAIRLGAIEYLTPPLEGEIVSSLLNKFKPSVASSDPIAGDAVTKALFDQAKQYAQSDATVLIRGESGVGKEVFANLVHKHSKRATAPFVAVNCAAIPENLLESELFGHVKGAFSGAVGDRKGRFQQAEGGTLLLDEISEMDLALQAKLLRVIQERVVDPVGSDKPIPVNVRLIATTNRELEEYVAEGNFREDLYFRLNVVTLDVPPLRERTGDIVPLAEFFTEKYAKQNGVKTPKFSKDAEQKLKNCYWKGNVRELENTIHRAVLLAAGAVEILPEHIMISPMSLKAMEARGDNVQKLVGVANQNAAAAQRYAAAAGGFQNGSGGYGTVSSPLGRSLADVESEHILATLNYCQGNREHAAQVLGISIKILRDKLNALESA